MNKIEGHWSPFGVRKHHFSSHLAEFILRYRHREDDLFHIEKEKPR